MPSLGHIRFHRALLGLVLLLHFHPCTRGEDHVLRFSPWVALEPAPPPPSAWKPSDDIVMKNGREMILVGDTLHETKSFSGKVVDADGNPIAGATGFISGSTSPVTHPVTTDENGEWKAGPFPIYTSVGTFVFEHPDFLKFHGNHVHDNPALAVMTRGNRISGTITDPTGKPVPNVPVFIRYRALETTATTDANGHYSHGSLPPGCYTVIPLAENWAFCGKEVTIEREDKIADFTLHPGRTVTIRFVTEDGKPFRDGEVRPVQWKDLTTTNSNLTYYIKGGKMGDDGVWTLEHAPLEELGFRVGWKYYYTHVHFLDEKKVYRPETAPENVYGNSGHLTVPPEQSDFTVKMIAADPPPPRAGLDEDKHIYLPEKLELTLVDQDGKPVPDAAVTATVALFDFDSLNETLWGDYKKKYEGSTRTDAAGKCVVDFSGFKRNQIVMFEMKTEASEDYLPARAYWRDDSLGREGHGPETIDPTNQIPEQWTMLMPRYDRALSGTVVDEQGNALPGVRVMIYAPQEIRYFGTLTPDTAGPNTSTKTDAEGKWCIPKLYHHSAPEYSLPGYLPGKSRGEPQPHVLKKADTLTVRVRDEAGNPVYGAWVYIGEAGIGGGYGSRDKEGCYDTYLDPADRRKLTIFISGWGYTPVLAEREIKSDNELVEVTLKRGKPLRLRAVDPDGKPVTGFSNVKLNLTWPENDNKPLRNGCYAEFDLDGRFVWENAPDIEADYKLDFGSGYSCHTQEKTYRMRPREEEYIITVLPRIRRSY